MEWIADRKWRLSHLYQIKTKTGGVMTFEPNWAQCQLLANLHYLNIILKARQLGVCLDPNTLVLKADFTWVKIGDMHPGDEIVSVDEHTSGRGMGRRMRRGIVEGVIRHIRKCYRITFDNGKTLICTGQHPWLSKKAKGVPKWRSIEGNRNSKLYVGTKIRRITSDTWKIGDFYRSEKDRQHKQASSLRDEIMYLIGNPNPSTHRHSDWWEGKEMPNILSGNYSTITKIDYIGDHEVVDLQTSEGTYIAEGYVSHNTTFFSLLFLDTCLFNDNIHAAILADNKETAKEVFRDKVKFAYDHLPMFFKQHAPAFRDNVNELRFGNGSTFRVGTSLRGGTLQLLHITEFAKICTDNPAKAAEIMSGALNTLHAGQFACIESTARGREGDFYEMCRTAIQNSENGKKLTAMDWKFWFFPWHKHPDYHLPAEDVMIPEESQKYFTKLAEQGVELTDDQKAWYVKKEETQGEYMKREFPSTPEEAFETANQGYYFAAQFSKARQERRICKVAPDDYVYKFVAADIGYRDATALWAFQIIGNEIHLLDYYENDTEAFPHYGNWILKLPYKIEKIFLPHDASQKSPATGRCYADYVRDMGFKTEIIHRPQNKMVEIEMLRAMFPRLYFNESTCAEGIKAAENYRKEWNEKKGCFRERPLHNWASHGTDALFYVIIAVQRLIGNKGLSAEQWREIQSRYR